MTKQWTGAMATPEPGAIVFLEKNPFDSGFTYDEALALLSKPGGIWIDDESISSLLAAGTDEEHTGAMIALVPVLDDVVELMQAVDPKVREPLEQLHCTILFLGEAATIDEGTQTEILGYVAELASRQPVVLADLFGFNVWNPDGPDPVVVAAVSGADLDDCSESVIATLDDADITYPEQHEPWVPHITLAYTKDPVAVLTDELLGMTGPIAFDRLRVAFAGVNHDFPLQSTVLEASSNVHVFHLPGKHDQSTHGHGAGQGTRPVKVLDQHEWVARGRYQLSDDPDVRASNVWAESYGGQRAVRDTMRNIHEGKANPVAVDENDPWLKTYASSENFMTDEKYGMNRVKDDVMNAAVNLDDRLEHHSVKIAAPLHRGMRVKNPEQKLKTGDTFDHDVSSWTTHEHIAKAYTRPMSAAGSHKPDDGSPVLMHVHGARGINLDNGALITQGGSGEHLLRGSFEITSAGFEGDTYVVNVRQL